MDFNIVDMDDDMLIPYDDGSRWFTGKMLKDFDRLTQMESSPDQMDRIRSRLEWNTWVKENHLKEEALDAMKAELIRMCVW